MTSYRLFAPAKINLTLDILNKRDDGYHNIRSHVAFADFGDWLNITISEGSKSILLDTSGDFAGSVPQENTLTKAFDLFSHAYDINCALKIDLEKNIPDRAGLGGGSSDAAALLRGLAHHYSVPVDQKLYDIALAIGADVPACLLAKPVIIQGIGEQLTPFSLQELGYTKPLNATLIWPGSSASTRDLYKSFDQHKNQRPKFSKNDFMAVAPEFLSVINDAISFLKSNDHYINIDLSGSGTCVFGLSYDATPKIENSKFPFIKHCKLYDLPRLITATEEA